jgi:integrase
MNKPRSAKRKGFPPNLYQKPDGYFWYRNPLNRKVKGLGRDRAMAFQESRAANAAIANMKKSDLVEWVSGIEQKTLEQWLDDYLPMWMEETSPAKGTVVYAKLMLTRIRKFDFAWMNMKDITTQHVSTALDKLIKESTPSVALNLRTRLSDVFRMAETKGLIETGKNPVSATSVPKYEVKRERLSLEQYQSIYKHASHWLKNAMDLALLTGQRRGDIANLKFADYRDGSLFITQIKTGFKLQQDGKIRLQAVNLSIEEVVKRCRTFVISKYLLHHVRTSGTYTKGDKIADDTLAAAFKVAREKAGIKAEEGSTPPTFHEIRSLSERLYKKEYGQEFAQSIMGHKHAKMTAEYDDLRGGGWKIIEAKAN